MDDQGGLSSSSLPRTLTYHSQRALDSGAHGIMIPMANSPVRLPPCPIHLYLFRVTDQPPQEIVRNVVSACKYPPNGIRGFGPMFTHAAGALGGSYKAAADKDLVIAVQIEHPDSVRDIEQIVKEDIDVAFVSLATSYFA